MPRRLAAVLPPLLGLLLVASLLGLEPERAALEAQGVAHLLAPDGAPAALFGPLAERIRRSGDAPFALRFEREGERPEAGPLYERAFASALNVVNAARQERGQAPLQIAPATEPSSVVLDLRLVREGPGLFLEAEVRSPAGREALPRSGPYRLPDRGALVPPLLAILVALAFRRTISALFAGIWIGAFLLRVGAGSGWLAAAPLGLWDVLAVYLRGELVSSFRIEIIGFVVALMALVGVVSRGGGIQGLVDLMLRLAGTVRSTLLVSFGMGCMIFFDDYSNCLIVGNTMRPLSDRLRISREKLAYVVDSTAAPVAGLSLLSTWVAFEVSTFAAQLPAAGITENPYVVFLQTLPFRFYSLFTLGFVLLNVLSGRDFGPMRAAEQRAHTRGELVRAGGTPLVSSELTEIEASPRMPLRAWNAVLPIATVIAVTVHEIFRAGGGYALLREAPERLLSLAGWTGLLSTGGGAGPLFAGSVAGLALALLLLGSNAMRAALGLGLAAALLLVPVLAEPLAAWLPAGLALYAAIGLALGGGFAAGLALFGRLLGPSSRPHLESRELGRAAFASTRGLSFAIVILFEAWMIGRVCQDIGTADYLVALTSGVVTAVWLPALLFGIACLVSFSTGTSWGTMSILLPNVVGLAAAVGASHPIGSLGLVLVCIGAVLEGSIFGDHCSPISDTTILSSVSAASDHIDHVRTQAPYALLTAAAAVAAGYLPTMFFPSWSFPLAMASGFGALFAVLWLFGRSARE